MQVCAEILHQQCRIVKQLLVANSPEESFVLGGYRLHTFWCLQCQDQCFDVARI